MRDRRGRPRSPGWFAPNAGVGTWLGSPGYSTSAKISACGRLPAASRIRARMASSFAGVATLVRDGHIAGSSSTRSSGDSAM